MFRDATHLPQAPLPEDLDHVLDPVVYLGTYRGDPCWAAGVPSGIQSPAGFVDVGESLEGAAEREVWEEVGIGIHDLRYAGSQLTSDL
jgi:NAD+ diphosphatase